MPAWTKLTFCQHEVYENNNNPQRQPPRHPHHLLTRHLFSNSLPISPMPTTPSPNTTIPSPFQLATFCVLALERINVKTLINIPCQLLMNIPVSYDEQRLEEGHLKTNAMGESGRPSQPPKDEWLRMSAIDIWEKEMYPSTTAFKRINTAASFLGQQSQLTMHQRAR